MNDETKQIDWSKWDSKEDCFAKYRHVRSNLVYGELSAEKPDISVMIPTFRRANLLKAAIDSALDQKTQYAYTISVVDNDGEIDSATDKLMKQYCAEYDNIVYYRNEQNIGTFGNWNRCIELAQAEWLCLLHDDDMLMESYVESAASLNIEGNTGLIISMSKIINTAEGGKLTIPEKVSNFIGAAVRRPKLRKWEWSPKSIFNPTCMLLNRRMCFDIGGFDDLFYPASDVPFAMKMIYYHKVLFLNTNLSVRRMECNSVLDLAIRNRSVEIYYRSGQEYFKKMGYSDKKVQQATAELTVGLYMSLGCWKSRENKDFLERNLGLRGKYANPLYQKIFYFYCLIVKTIRTVM